MAAQENTPPLSVCVVHMLLSRVRSTVAEGAECVEASDGGNAHVSGRGSRLGRCWGMGTVGAQAESVIEVSPAQGRGICEEESGRLGQQNRRGGLVHGMPSLPSRLRMPDREVLCSCAQLWAHLLVDLVMHASSGGPAPSSCKCKSKLSRSPCGT